MTKLKIFIIILLLPFASSAQDKDSLVIKQMYDFALTSSESYENLRYLTKKIGGRIVGSPQSIAAVEYTKQVMQELNLDKVYLQETKANYWKRGYKEFGNINSSIYGSKEVNIASLGTSISTPESGLVAEVIEVKSIKELEELGKQKIEGKIVFFNQPMNPTYLNTFRAYGEAVWQRVNGASKASNYGAVAVIVRSMTTREDEFPHTGVMNYKDALNKIPAVAICTKHANLLSGWLKNDPNLKFYFKTNCSITPDVTTFNVIGEIKGSEKPDEIITVGGHLDAWDTGEGAHDDGAGSVQSIDVLRLFKQLGIKPKHTIRAVLFMDEEISQVGAKKYFENARDKKENHFFAIEADRGGAVPTGFSLDMNDVQLKKVLGWKKYFDAWELHDITKGGSGVDVGPLKELKVPLAGLVTDNQRYFDYHHSANDTFENINKRELQLGSAAMAMIIYLVDKYGL